MHVRVVMKRFLSLFFAMFLVATIALNGPSNAQQNQTSITSSPEALFRFLNATEYYGDTIFRILRNDTCFEITQYLRGNVFADPGNGQSVPITCPLVNEAWRLYSGSEYYWADCMPERGQIGTAAHITACLTGYATYRDDARTLSSCGEVYDHYARALSEAVDPATFFGFRRTTVPSGRTVTATREGVTIAVSHARRNTLTVSVEYGERDCSIAAEVIRATGGDVDWLACTNYDPANVTAHVTQCLGNEARRLRDCPSIRSAYEDRLSAAYGGVFPPDYRTVTCDLIEPILAARATPTPVRTETAPQVPRPQTSTRSSGLGGGFYASLIILGLAGAIGIAIAFAAKKPAKGLTPYPEPPYRDHPPSDEEAKELIAQINARFDAGTGEAWGYLETHISDSVELSSSDGPKNRDVEFDLQARVVRSLGAMSRPDREMLRVIELLEALGDQGISRRLKASRLGIVYGDGKADIAGYAHTSVYRKYLTAKGLAAGSDFVRLGMNQMNLNVEVAKGRVVSLVETLQGLDWKDHLLVQEAAARLRGGAAWAGGNDLTGNFDPQAELSLFFGLEESSGTPVRYSGEGSVITIAAPGSGKTQCNVLPNLLEWSGPAIVLDVKGEIFRDTAAWRAKNVGPVYRFAPLEPEESHHFNPLDLVRSDPEHLWEDARFLASMVIVPTSKQDPYWENRAQDFVTAAIAAVCVDPEGTEGRSMARVVDYTHGHGLPDMLDRLQTSGIRSLERAATSWESTITENAKQFDGFLSSAQTAMSAWESAKIERAIASSDWHPFDLREAPYPTIYITLKAGEIDVYSSLLRVFIAQHIRTLVSELPEPGTKPILFMLDELPRLKYMPPIEEALELGRQYGIKLWMFAQSIGQLEHAYPNAKGMIGSCAVRTFMNPSMHDGTAERISKELGTFESPLDGSKHNIAEPQELAGTRYNGLQLVLPSGGKPIRTTKCYAYETEPYASRRKETLG